MFQMEFEKFTAKSPEEIADELWDYIICPLPSSSTWVVRVLKNVEVTPTQQRVDVPLRSLKTSI